MKFYTDLSFQGIRQLRVKLYFALLGLFAFDNRENVKQL